MILRVAATQSSQLPIGSIYWKKVPQKREDSCPILVYSVMLNFWDMVLEVTLGDGIIREELSLYMYAASPSSKFWLLSETHGISRSTSLGKAPQPYLSGLWTKAVIQVAEDTFSKTSIQTSNAYGTCWNMLPFKMLVLAWHKMVPKLPLKAHWKGPWYIFHNQGTSFNSMGSISWNSIFSVQSISLSKGVFLKASCFPVEPSS